MVEPPWLHFTTALSLSDPFFFMDILYNTFMDRSEFEQLVTEAILDLPPEILAKMDNVGIVIEDWPTPEESRKGGSVIGNILLGLYQGVPRTKRGPGYTLVLPDKITIFQKAIEAVAQSPEAVKQQVKSTVWHEIAHHFGFDEQGARRVSQKRRKT